MNGPHRQSTSFRRLPDGGAQAAGLAIGQAIVRTTGRRYHRQMSSEAHKGSCLCGAVTFDVRGPIPAPDACHCRLCRKTSGHYLAGADVPRDAVTIHGADNVTWYHSSEKVRRGFCATCGASLFFDPLDTTKHDWLGISMGAFDTPTNTRLAIHIFVADKGDYYEICDGLPQNQH